MKLSDRNNIIKWANQLSDEELKKEYYKSVYDSLGSQTDEMYELDYDMQDIIERQEYEKFMSQKCDLLEDLCGKRGITLWENHEYELAKAFTYIDMERMDMGDSHEEIVEFLCEKAEIDFDSDCAEEDEHYYEKKSVEAYEKMIKDGSIQKIIGSIVDEIYDNFDYIRRVMVYHENKFADVMDHPTVKAICVIDDYIQSIHNETVCSKEQCSKIREIKEKLLATDIELCYIGHEVGQSYFRYLDPEYYFISNTAFTVGHILSEDETERELGEYSIHAEPFSSLRKNGDDQGYTIAFNRENGNIMAHIYTFTTTHEPFNMTHIDTECKMLVDATNIEISAKKIADKINELTKKDFSNGKEEKNNQSEISTVRKRKAR